MENYPKVIKVLDTYRVVINKGAKHGIKEGQKFKLVEVTKEELRDPDTGEFLGYLEIPKGKGEIIEVKDTYSILESINWEKIPKTQNSLFSLFGAFYDYRKKGFENPKVGDIAVPLEG